MRGGKLEEDDWVALPTHEVGQVHHISEEGTNIRVKVVGKGTQHFTKSSELTIVTPEMRNTWEDYIKEFKKKKSGSDK